MSLCQILRKREHRQNMLELTRQRHQGSEITDVLADTRYLQLQLNDENGREAYAYLNIDIWLQSVDTHLPGIPWLQVPLSYIAHWLSSMQFSFLVGEVTWDVQHVMQPASPLPDKLLLLPSLPCSLLCCDWPCSDEELLKSSISAYQLPFKLQYILGHSSLSLSDLIGAAVGDLLLIKDYCPCLCVGDRRLFSFSYQTDSEVIVEDIIEESSEVYRAEDETLLDWGALPVQIEFVLDSKFVALSELEEIRPGSTLSVNSGAEKKVKIYLNKKFFAFGELVAFDDGGLAIEISQVNTGSFV